MVVNPSLHPSEEWLAPDSVHFFTAHMPLRMTFESYGGPGGRGMRRWRLDDNDVQMDENGLPCDDIDATVAMCNALSDNHDVQCDASVAM